MKRIVYFVLSLSITFGTACSKINTNTSVSQGQLQSAGYQFSEIDVQSTGGSSANYSIKPNSQLTAFVIQVSQFNYQNKNSTIGLDTAVNPSLFQTLTMMFRGMATITSGFNNGYNTGSFTTLNLISVTGQSTPITSPIVNMYGNGGYGGYNSYNNNGSSGTDFIGQMNQFIATQI